MAKVRVGRDGLSDLTGVMCPTKCGNEVVYNGNYFCDNFENCGWAFDGKDRELFKRMYDGLMANREGNYRSG